MAINVLILGDGIGGIPYNISGGSSQDLYPLIALWKLTPSLDVIHVNDDFDELTLGWGYNRFDSIQDGVDASLEREDKTAHKRMS